MTWSGRQRVDCSQKLIILVEVSPNLGMNCEVGAPPPLHNSYLKSAIPWVL